MIAPSRRSTKLTRFVDERNPLPPGSLSVGVGLTINGVSTYAFLAIARRSLDTAGFDVVAVMWALIVVLGPGLFQSLEQEVARLSAARRSAGEGARGVIGPIATLGCGIAVVVLVALGVAAPALANEFSDGDVAVIAALGGALVGYAVGHLVRGVLSGHGRFRAYGRYFALEGLGRAGGAAGLGLAGIATPARLCWVIALAPILAAGVVRLVDSDVTLPGPRATFGDLSRALGWLGLGALLTGLMLNVGPVSVRMIDASEGESGRFTSALVVARIPLFLFQAVLAALLPHLSTLAAEGRHQELRRRLVMLVGALGCFGLAFTLGSALLGPFLVDGLLDHRVSRLDMFILAASMTAFMVAITLDQALIALGAHRRMALGWLVVFVVFGVGIMVFADLEPFTRVELSLAASAVGAVAVMGAGVLRWTGQRAMSRARPALAPTIR